MGLGKLEVGEIVLYGGEAAVCVGAGVGYSKLKVFTQSGTDFSCVVNDLEIDKYCKAVKSPPLIKLSKHNVSSLSESHSEVPHSEVPIEVISYTNIPGVNDLSEYRDE